MRKLHNPRESLDNVTPAPKYREHGTRVSSLLSERSLEALRASVTRR